MSFFNRQKIWDELKNFINRRKQENYIQLNFILLSDESVIDNTDYMNELQESVHISEMYWECENTLYILLISAFYFELASVSEHIQEDQYHCYNRIQCCLSEIAVVKILSRFNIFNLIFITDVKTLGYYGEDLDLCVSCHWYQKKINFLIHHHTEFVIIYTESVTWGWRKLSAFSQTIEWFENHMLDTSFETASHRDSQNWFCKACNLNISLKRSNSHGQQRSWICKKS